jgi:hypothetical protein
MKYVRGTQEVITRLNMERNKAVRRLAEAIEKTCVDVSNHAKAGHAGNQAHMNARYQNRTSTLTRSIMPELVEARPDRVVGIVFTNIEYAPFVELGTVRNRPYPFLYPALQHGKPILQDRVRRAIQP